MSDEDLNTHLKWKIKGRKKLINLSCSSFEKIFFLKSGLSSNPNVWKENCNKHTFRTCISF